MKWALGFWSCLLACQPAQSPIWVPPGCVILQAEPDPAAVTDPVLRASILASGMPWSVQHLASGIEFLLVPEGRVACGASDGDAEAAPDEYPAHEVRVQQPFYLGRTEVTQSQWQRVLGENPSFFVGEANAPVEQVDRVAVQGFLSAAGLDLPTEAQWEFACRAGDPRPRYGEPAAIAWTRANAGQRSQDVGQKRANALGFHDLLGSVWEWTLDSYRADTYKRHADGVDATWRSKIGAQFVLRGGSWYDSPRRARSSARYFAALDYRGSHVGLRAVLPFAAPGA